MFSYAVGVVPSAIIGLVTGAICVPWTLRQNRLHPSFTVGIAAAAFSVAYSILNLLLQIEHVSVGHLRVEIADGRLALRVTSVVVGVSFCLVLRRLAKEEPVPESSGGADPDLDYRIYLAERRRGPWPMESAAAQGVLFMLVLVGLWAFVITSRSSTVTALMNWSFAFIVDDFAMATNYVAYRRVPPPRLDALKIALGSSFTFALFLVALFQEFASWVGWVTLVFVVIVLLVAIYRRVAPFVRSGMSTWGILPDPDDWRPYTDREILERALGVLAENGVLTEAELAAKLHLVPLLYVHGMKAHEILAAPARGAASSSSDGAPDGQSGGSHGSAVGEDNV
jgi:hypothetical protein